MAKLSLICSVALFVFASASTPPVYANPPGENELPTGAQITAGSGSVSQTANTLNVSQQSGKLITNWQTFNVGSKATVNFQQPNASSIALNRVLTEGASQIHGNLNANGQVFLVNPSGITFAPGARVDVGGLVSSTLNISDDDFLSGNMVFENNSNAGSIVNQGHLSSANGGYVALISPRVTNEGTITTPGGTTALAAGTKVSLDFAGDQLVNLTVDQGAIDALIANKGLIQADNGTVMMSAKAADHLTRSVVNNSGVIEAQGVVEQGGRILLTADGGDVSIANTLDVSSDAAQGGDVIIIGDEITLAGNTTINARGATGGGDVLVGGDWQGSGDLHQATTVTMEEGASINASATNNGDGGKIVLWSDIKNKDSVTSVAGTLTARGGANGGDGGAIETSGAHIDTANVAVNAGAEEGTGGLWLIDPYNYTIDATAAGNIVGTLNTGTSVTVTTTADNTSYGSSGNNTDLGDIFITSDIVTGAMSGDATLTLQAERHISVGGGVGIDATQNGNTAKLNVTLLADTDQSSDGINIITANGIKTNGGDLTFGDLTGGGDIYVNGTIAQSFVTAGGDITVNGETIIANSSASGVTFDSTGGDIVFGGQIDSGNLYTYVDGPNGQANSWDWARTDARNGTAGGAALGDSYLVTINSSLENSIAGSAAGYRGAWIGAYRPSGLNWRWVDGPEAGQTFYVANSGVGGGTTQSGFYSNFGSGEPNGHISSGENRGQFFGGAGLWNDLRSTTTFSANQDTQYSVLGYVRETNLAPTALNINAGSGAVTVGGGIGSNKVLSSLNVTSSGVTVNGSSLITTGVQTFNSGIAINSSSDLDISANAIITQGDLIAKAVGDITYMQGVLMTNGGDSVFWANTDGQAGGGKIYISEGASISTGGGHAWFGGGSGSTTWNGLTVGDGAASGSNGIEFFGSIDTTAANNVDGAIFMHGSTTDTVNARGILIGNNSATLSSGTNSIQVISDDDIRFNGNVSVTSLGSDITFAADADNSGTGTISQLNGSLIVNSYGGDITFGGGDASASGFASGFEVGNGVMSGIRLQALSVNSEGGDIVFRGQSGTTSSSGNIAYGIGFDDDNMIRSGNGKILIHGIGRNTSNGGYSQGVTFGGFGGPTTVTSDIRSENTSADAIKIIGDASASTATGSVFARGLTFWSPNTTIAATGTGGGVTLEGHRSRNFSYAVQMEGGSVLANGGPINIIGLEDDTGGVSEVRLNNVNLGSLTGSSIVTSSSDITIESDYFNLGGRPNIATSGDVTWQSRGASFGQSISTDWINWNTDASQTIASLTLGKSSNTSNVTLSRGDLGVSGGVLTVDGGINVFGGVITVNQDLNTTGGGAAGDVLFKANNAITLGSGFDIMTAGGDVTFWADSDNNALGNIVLTADNTIDTRTAADRTAGTHTSGGGNIVLAGGADTDADDRPDGFASTNASHGVKLGSSGSNTTTLYSGGGAILVKGKMTAELNSGGYHGVDAASIFVANSGAGSIAIEGESADSYAVTFSQNVAGVTALDLKSAAVSGTAISISGINTSNINHGVVFNNNSGKSLQATGGGNIDITGRTAADKYGVWLQEMNILASSGDITIDGGTAGIRHTGSTFGSIIGAKAGTDVTSSSSNVMLTADRVIYNSDSIVDTTGQLTVQPFSTSFSSALTWPDSKLSLDSTLAGLTLGKAGNQSDIHLHSDITTEGPQTYFAHVILSGDITLANTGSEITFNGTINSDSTARSLTLSPGASSAIFNYDVGGQSALANLTVNSKANVNGDVTTIGDQNWTDAINVFGPGIRVFTGNSLTFDQVSGFNKDITLLADNLTLNDTVGSTGALVIAPNTAGKSVGVGNGSGDLDITLADLALLQDGFSSVTIGSTNAGDLQVGGLTGLNDTLILRAGSTSSLEVADAIGWSQDESLTLTAGHDIWIRDNIGITGSGATLNLLYGGTDGTTAPATGYNYYLDLPQHSTINFADTTANLKIGNQDFILLDSVTSLSSANAAGNYALKTDLSLAGTTYANAFYAGEFTGRFDGLGHELDGLKINANAGGNFGLFGQISGASVRHVGVTNIDILGQSTSQAAANDLRIGGIAGNVSGNNTVIDGVWTTGVIATKQGSLQDVFYAGGLVGGHDSGSLNVSRSYSSAAVSSQGSNSAKLGIGGLLGDSGSYNGVSGSGGSAVHLTIDQSYSIGSIVEGQHGGYFATGGLLGVAYGSSATITDSFSHSNVVGGGSSGGLVGYTLPSTVDTYQRLYTTEDSFGNGFSSSSSYKSDTLDAATNNGAQLPSGWSSSVWNVGELPRLVALAAPAEVLYVQVTGGSGAYGDLVAPTYQVVDRDGVLVTFGMGDYNDLTGIAGTGRYTLDQFSRAGSYNSVSYLSGFDLTGNDASLYSLNPFSTAGSYTVNPRALTASLSNTSVTKVYDGTTAAPTGFTPTYTLGNFANGDTAASISFGSSLFNDADVADATTLTVSGLSITGITGSNGSLTSDYSIVSSLGVAATITQKALTISSLTAANKVYDQTTTATVNSAAINYAGLISGDVLSLDTTSGAFDSKNVGNNKLVTLSNTYTGADVGNYAITDQTSTLANITQKALTISGLTAANKTYDQNTTATVNSAGINYAGLISGDVLSLATTSGTFNDKNAGSNRTVTLTNTYTGADVANYAISDQTSTMADIARKALTISGITAADKVYDQTTTATVNSSGINYTGLISGDILSLDNTSGVFDNKNAGDNKTVTLSNTYTGADKDNYAITDQTSTMANITQKALTVTGITAANKIYDQTTTAAVNSSGINYAGLISGDVLSLGSSNGAFDNKNVGNGKAVTLSNVYTGADVGNYAITDQTATTASIAPKALTISGIGVNNKFYDGSAAATTSTASVVYTGLIAGDDLALSSVTGVFDNADAGVGKTVSLNSHYTGADFTNYTVTDQLSATANINQQALSISANSVIQPYDGIAFRGGNGVNYSGFVNSESHAVLNGALIYTGTSQGAIDAGTYAITPGGYAADNYLITYVDGLLKIEGSTDMAVDAGIEIKFAIASNQSRPLAKAGDLMITSEYESLCTVVETCSSGDGGVCVGSRDSQCQ